MIIEINTTKKFFIKNILELALIIIKAALSQARVLEKIVFVDYGDKAFQKAWNEREKWNTNNIEEVIVVSGLANLEKTTPRLRGITDYSLHKCKVIVNTTFNMEGKFISSHGLSGFIASRTGSGKAQIQKELVKNITEFNSRLKNY